jgi:replicative DNA helicase
VAFEVGADQGSSQSYSRYNKDKFETAFQPGEKPHDLETEKALLASILLDNSNLLDLQNSLSKEDFFLPAHQSIYDAMVQLQFKNIPIDLTTLANYLREQAKLDRIGGAEYLSQIMSVPSSSVHVIEYAKITRDLAWRRKLISAGEQCRGLALKAGNTQDIAAEIEKSVFSATQEKKDSQMAKLGELLPGALEEFEKRTDNKGKSESGVLSGLTDLDECLNGFRPGQLIVLAARPGMGKTSLASNIMFNVATKMRKAVLFMSLEMTKEEVVERMISFSSNIDMGKLRTGNLSPEDYQELFYAAEECEDAPLFIDDRSVVSPYDVLAQARKLKSTLNLEKQGIELGLIVADYIQIMKSGGRTENRSLEVGAITGGLKAIAKDLKVPVIALSQLNREVSKRGETGSKRPQLSDLKDSGSIEADADVVMFIHREQSEQTDSRAPSEAEIVVAKQRSGPTKNIKVTWLGHLTKFTNFAHSSVNENTFNIPTPEGMPPEQNGGF